MTGSINNSLFSTKAHPVHAIMPQIMNASLFNKDKGILRRTLISGQGTISSKFGSKQGGSKKVLASIHGSLSARK